MQSVSKEKRLQQLSLKIPNSIVGMGRWHEALKEYIQWLKLDARTNQQTTQQKIYLQKKYQIKATTLAQSDFNRLQKQSNEIHANFN
jgi:hypothetical protein